MPLDPLLLSKLPLIDGVTVASLSDPVVFERFLSVFATDEPWNPPTDVVIEDLELAAPGRTIPLRVYRPSATARAAVVWLHGGGFTLGDLDMPEAHVVAAELAHRAQAVVVSVGYRLAGENVRFPAPVDDVLLAWDWTTEQVDDRLPMALGGASAGAAIATTTALWISEGGRRPADSLLLAYPFAHFPCPLSRWSSLMRCDNFRPSSGSLPRRWR